MKLGQLAITKNAVNTLIQSDIIIALDRYTKKDWGEVDEEDKQLNDEALKNGGRILAAYQDSNDTKFWIITEADRSVTTILLPEDY